MSRLKGAKISKKEFKFEVRSRYDYTKHYKKLERPPIEKIKDVLKSFSAPKKKTVEKQKPVATSGGPTLLIPLIIIALLLVGGAFYFLSQISEIAEEKPLVVPPELDISYSDAVLISAGTRTDPKSIAAAKLGYSYNGSNATLYIAPLKERVYGELFILNSELYEATSYPEFISSLRLSLTDLGFGVSDVLLNELDSLPRGSIVLVPSGVIPGELLGINSDLSIAKLAEKGVVFVYIGHPFTRYLNEDGIIVTTPSEVLRKLPFIFNEGVVSPSKNLSLFQPLYSVSATGGWSNYEVYGSVSVLKAGNGAVIFLPQTLDGGWKRDGKAAAKDVLEVLISTPWASRLSDFKNYSLDNEGNQFFFSELFDGFGETAVVWVVAEGLNANKTKLLFVPLSPLAKGSMSIAGGNTVVPTEISGQFARITARLLEDQPSVEQMVLKVYSSEGDLVREFPQGPISTQTVASIDIPIEFEEGEYILKLENSAGKVFASGYMKVSGIDIIHRGKGKKNSEYIFDITLDGKPVVLPEVEVIVDDGKLGRYSFTEVSSVTIDVGQYTGGGEIPIGEHIFLFKSGPLEQEVIVERVAQKTIFTDPLFLLVLFLSGGIVGLGIIFSRKEEVKFVLDIPDFPPVSRTKVPLTSEEILSVFDKVNELYRWEMVPLTIKEIKNGFRHMLHEGKPIYITDYNVEFLLDELERRGLVKESLGYYGLTAWEKKYPVEYLALMRKIRDICINNAVPFTQLGESKEADSVLTIVGQPMYVHFYHPNRNLSSLVEKALKTASKGITIILFSSGAEKRKFLDLLKSSVSPAFLIFKMEHDSGNIQFNTAEELDKFIKEMKTV